MAISKYRQSAFANFIWDGVLHSGSNNFGICNRDANTSCGGSCYRWAEFYCRIPNRSQIDENDGIAYNTILSQRFRIVIDTNVFLSALRSRNGASFRLLFLIGEDRFETCVSVPLILEYEHAALKSADLKMSAQDIDDIIDYICKASYRHKVFYLWRPFLKDPNDDFVLELAAGSQCDFIITFNKGDFRGVEKFGIRVATPKEFLAMIGEKE